MTGRDRTCGASRFRRALYRLSYGHVQWLAEPESNRRPPPYQRGALPPELSAVDRFMGKAGFEPAATVCVRHVLYR